MLLSRTDPFTGTWNCNLHKSKFSTLAPLSWTQYITASPTELRVREEISRDGGPPAVVTVHAKFDGADYPVYGSPGADFMAYTREGLQIAGTARRKGLVCLRETLTLSADFTVMSMTYSVLSDGKELASGVAVFERADG